MNQPSSLNRIHWSGRIAFILAAAGSAIGLGNIWKFPYITGQNGGGAFVLAYLITIAIVGFPILIAELFVGQSSQSNVVQAFEKLTKKAFPWRPLGWVGLVAGFCILSFYSVVGGWVLDFEFRSLVNDFAGKNDDEIQAVLGSLLGDPMRVIFWHAVFMGATVAIVASGVRAGVERWNKILMPALAILLAVLLVRAFFLEGFGASVRFLFEPDFAKLTPQAVLIAVGHAFFTLSLGLGAMITYGSYLSKDENLIKTSLAVVVLDTLFALIAGMVIFAIVFTFGLEPSAGPSLIFKTLPMLFMKLPAGTALSFVFFMLVAFAALTSAISLLEVVVAYWVEKHGASRKKTAAIVGVLAFALGIPSALSFNIMSEFTILGQTFFDFIDKLTSNIMLPLGGALISLFFGWVLGPQAAQTVVGSKYPLAAKGLLWTTRILSPLAVFWVFWDFIRS